MKAVNEALCRFWSGFGVPAYIEGRVPTDAQYPYITFGVVSGRFGTMSMLTATCWHKAPGATMAACEMLDAIAGRISDSGLMIPVEDHGYMILYRCSAFQGYVQDPVDQDVVGGITNYEMHCFVY